jgi:hypothetical protein
MPIAGQILHLLERLFSTVTLQGTPRFNQPLRRSFVRSFAADSSTKMASSASISAI